MAAFQVFIYGRFWVFTEDISPSLSICFILSTFAVNTAWATDPTRHISQYAHTTWRIQDGVLNGSPYAITQTTDGYLWIGTQAGLLRFDGVRFIPWNPPDGMHLPASNVTSLLAASDGCAYRKLRPN
jgi:ligand-binding sensor domain-containing protein